MMIFVIFVIFNFGSKIMEWNEYYRMQEDLKVCKSLPTVDDRVEFLKNKWDGYSEDIKLVIVRGAALELSGS